MDTSEILSCIDAEISRLQQVRAALAGLNTDGHAAKASAAKPRRKMSAAARKRMAAAQRKRWAAAKKTAAK